MVERQWVGMETSAPVWSTSDWWHAEQSPGPEKSAVVNLDRAVSWLGWRAGPRRGSCGPPAGCGSAVAVKSVTGARVGIGVGVGPAIWGTPAQAASSKLNRRTLSHRAAAVMMRRCMFREPSSRTALGVRARSADGLSHLAVVRPAVIPPGVSIGFEIEIGHIGFDVEQRRAVQYVDPLDLQS
jgi:hypothetical protein